MQFDHCTVVMLDKRYSRPRVDIEIRYMKHDTLDSIFKNFHLFSNFVILCLTIVVSDIFSRKMIKICHFRAKSPWPETQHPSSAREQRLENHYCTLVLGPIFLPSPIRSQLTFHQWTMPVPDAAHPPCTALASRAMGYSAACNLHIERVPSRIPGQSDHLADWSLVHDVPLGWGQNSFPDLAGPGSRAEFWAKKQWNPELTILRA